MRRATTGQKWGLKHTARKRRRNLVPQVEVLEDRSLLTTALFVRELGNAAQFTKSQTSMTVTSTNAVEVGHSVIIEFAVKPTSKSTSPPPTLTATATTPGGQTFNFQLDANVLNPNPGGGSGGAVQTAIFSLHDLPSSPEIGLPVGTVFKVNFDSSDAQAMTVAEFSGLAVTTELTTGFKALDRVAVATGPSSTTPASSGATATTRFANELVLGAIGVRGQVDSAAPDNSTNNLGFTAGSGFTVWHGNGTPSGNAGNKNSSIHPEFKSVSATGQYVADGVLNTNANGPWAAAVATYVADKTSHFSIAAAPDNDPVASGVQIDAGQTFNLTVKALDDSNAVSSGYRGKVHFTVTNPVTGEVLPADYTFTSADAGVHTFTNLTKLLKTGARAITVADANNDPTIASASTTVFIIAPTFTISDASAAEGSGSMSFTISLDRPIDIPVTVDVSFADGTATGGGVDYNSTTQHVTFAANDTTSKTISVAVTDDTIVEGDETFTASLSTATNLGSRFVDLSDTGTGTITDTTDTATVSITANDATAAEPNNNGQFTVTLTALSSTPTVVNYTIGGTATGGSDYTALSGSVTIPANTLSQTIDVSVIDDSLVEGDETVVLTLSSIASGDPQISVGSPSTATVTIADTTDTASVSITAIDAVAAEPNNNGQYTVTLSALSSTPTVVAYSVSGSATAGSDYTALSGSVTIPANTSSATIDLTVIDDSLVEGDETVTVTLTSITSGDPQISIGSPASATVTISDTTDAAAVTITANDAVAAEPGNNGQFTVTLSAPSSTATTINYTVAGTATSGSDYTALSGSVTIPALATTATIDVTVLDDAIVEGDETVVVTLSSIASGDPQISIGTPASATVTISDTTDTATASIVANDAVAAEPNNNGQFTVSLSALSSTPTVVGYSVTGTALGGSDYTALTGTVTIPANTASATINVTVIDDSIVEGDETVIVTLTAINSGDPQISIGTPSSATVTISDTQDTATVSVTASDAVAAEPNNNGQFTVSLSALSSTPTTVSYTVTGTATAGNDYMSLSGSVTIPANTSSATIDVTVLDDALIEGDETVIVTLGTITSGDPQISVGTPASATVTISDTTDTGAVTIVANDATAAEPGNNGQFTVLLSAFSSTATVISYTLGGTATAGSDYSSLSGTVTIPANTLSATIDITVLDDTIVEGDETVIATLASIVSGDPQISIGTPSSATVTISDTTDTATVSIVASDAVAVEPGNNGQFTVALSAISSTPTVVNYTVGGTATSGSDYTALSGSVTIPALTLSATITVAVLDDSLVEGDETVIVTLGSIGSGDPQISIGTPSSATVTISDTTDAATATIAATDSTAAEPADNGQFTVTLSALSSTPTVISYTVSGTATPGSDYTALSGTVTVPANTATATISVSVLDDSLVEGSETVIVTLSAITSGDPQISIGSPSSATVTIADTQDTASVSISANDATAVEPGNNGQFTVTLSALSSTATTISYTVSGTATAGSDYTTLSGSVTIPALSSTATIDVSVLDDSIVEADETVIVTLSSISGDSQISIGSPSSATVTISDPNDSATFNINDVSRSENGGTITFTVSLSNPVDAQVSVVAATADGTATTSDSDYVAKSATVTFAAGETSKSFTVTLNDDTKIEPDETFAVNLSGASVAGRLVTIGDSQGIGTIVNDDKGVVSISLSDSQAGEPHDNGQFLVSLSQASSQATVVSYTVGGTATEGTDYATLSPHSVTIPAGSTSATIDILVNDDFNTEGDETVVITLGAITSGVTSAISIAAPPDNAATLLIKDRTSIVLDNGHNGDDGFATSGFILNTSTGYLGDYSYGGNDFNPEYASWTATNLQPGNYRVSITWPQIALTPLATNAPFSVYDGTTSGTLLKTVLVNQQVQPTADVVDSGTNFQDLATDGNAGIYTITGNSLAVKLTDVGINGLVIADAVRIELLSPLEAAAAPADAPATPVSAGGLSAAQLAPVVNQALASWIAANPDSGGRLSGVTARIGDLPGNVLGLASPTTGTIWLDANGAGHGWSMAAGSGSASGAFDLQTVVAHELGHLLGLPDLDAAAHPQELMAGQLRPGLAISPLAVDAALAAQPTMSVPPAPALADRAVAAFGADEGDLPSVTNVPNRSLRTPSGLDSSLTWAATDARNVRAAAGGRLGRLRDERRGGDRREDEALTDAVFQQMTDADVWTNGDTSDHT